MSPLRGEALILKLCLRALEEGIIPKERRGDVYELIGSLPAERADPEVLVERGLLTQAQLDALLGRPAAAQAPSVSAAAPTYKRGDKIGMYTVVRQLSRGPMGSVYIAEHPVLRHKVAIRVRRRGDEAFVARFYHQAKVLAELHHPNIVSVHDAGEHEGCAFLVIDVVEGRALGDFIRRGDQLPMLVLLRLMAKIAGALQHAHEKDVILRDINPYNIVVGPLGEPVLVELGLAMPASGDPHAQGEFAVIGTPSYMSPEQAQGKSAHLSCLTDIWSLGASMFHLVAGRPPYPGTDLPALFEQLASSDPVDLSPVEGKCPEFVADIVGRCLRKDPAERYRSADELKRALEAAVDHMERLQTEDAVVAPPRRGQNVLLHVEYQEPDLPGAFREYEVGRYLGGGTYGEVYHARERQSGKDIALKILKREWVADEQAVERFRREAMLLARLAHPNIVKVWNFGRYGRTFFIAMEFLEGPTLKEVIIERAPMDVHGALRIFLPVLCGIAAMHEAGVVHRDLKPGNMSITSDRVVVFDLGLARAADLGTMTKQGVFMGTPCYASPEQASGRRAIAESDVYAAGVVLFEMLSARRPHDDKQDFHELMGAIARQPHDPVTTYRDDLPRPLVRTLGRMLALDPRDRPSAAETERSLRQLL